MRPDEPPAGSGVPFPLRSSDFDPSHHANNAVYLAAIEDQLATRPALLAQLHRTTIEYLTPILPGAQLNVHTRDDPHGFTAWFVVDSVTQAMSRVAVHPSR